MREWQLLLYLELVWCSWITLNFWLLSYYSLPEWQRPKCFITGNPDAKSWNYKNVKYCELCHKAMWMSTLIPGGLIFFSFTLTQIQISPGSTALSWHETSPELCCFSPEWVLLFAEGLWKGHNFGCSHLHPSFFSVSLTLLPCKIQGRSSIIGFRLMKNWPHQCVIWK